MFDPNLTLLPVTATPLAKALDVLEERLFALPVQMITKDPWTVDAGWLDHLAWENSVDVWDSDWSEAVKRQVIAASAEVHRFKGTPFAIKNALLAFDVHTDFLEWWEPEGVADGLLPGSFRVTAYSGTALYSDDQNYVSNRMIRAMTAVVKRAAPVSRRMHFRLGTRYALTTTAKPGILQRALDQRTLTPQPPKKSLEGQWSVASGLRKRGRHEASLSPQPGTHAVSAANTAGAGLRARLRLSSILTVNPRGGAAYAK